MRRFLILLAILLCIPASGNATELLRVFTWQGYVSAEDLARVNLILRERRIDVSVAVIEPYAEGPEQMFRVLRENRADLSFLTINYIQMQEGRTARLLQGIDVSRLHHYAHILPELRDLPMGSYKGKLLYVPFGGGAYGIWANMNRLRPEQLPRRLNDLLLPQWKNHISLTSGQVQPNVALAYMAGGEAPFLLDTLVRNERREEAKQHLLKSQAKHYLHALYAQVREFWTVAPTFAEDDLLVASYGPEISGRRAMGQTWQLVQFEEGNTVWLDTMNLHKDVRGAKLEAAYVFIDHMLTNQVQRRVVEGLSMVAVTRTVNNPLLKENPNFFRSSHFWPPYTKLSDNLMREMSENAMPRKRAKP